MNGKTAFRTGAPADALAISALATYVFFDTYAAEGLRDDLAREARAGYSEAAFTARLGDPAIAFSLAHEEDFLVAFAELHQSTPCPARPGLRAELVSLYVHPRFHGRGIGTQLLARSERAAASGGHQGLWLSAWSGNGRALAFYAARHYEVVGSVDHVIEGTAYENKVLVRMFEAAAP